MENRIRAEVFLTAQEVAQHLRYADERPVIRMIKAGKFGRPLKIGRRYLILAKHVKGIETNAD